MTHAINLPSGDNVNREEVYTCLLPQIEALIQDESNLIANLANTAAVLKEAFDFFWVGFYLVAGEELVLGPFQGSVACTRIPYGKGVCGTCWAEAQTQLVPDVDAFPGHIACSSASRSEIVVPLIAQDKMVAVLDIDSDQLNDFTSIDQIYLEKIIRLLAVSMG